MTGRTARRAQGMLRAKGLRLKLPSLHDFQDEPWLRALTVKLRGRPEASDQSRGRKLSSGARGDPSEYHGPLQRLLDRMASPDAVSLLLLVLVRKEVGTECPTSRIG